MKGTSSVRLPRAACGKSLVINRSPLRDLSMRPDNGLAAQDIPGRLVSACKTPNPHRAHGFAVVGRSGALGALWAGWWQHVGMTRQGSVFGRAQALTVAQRRVGARLQQQPDQGRIAAGFSSIEWGKGYTEGRCLCAFHVLFMCV